ncbi:hypothetical protein MTO96_005042 [Rhipicephalus appendiculatus]
MQRGPSQQATAVPFDLTSQPYGGYGLGYGRHYGSPPPPPPYGGQSPYGHRGYYDHPALVKHIRIIATERHHMRRNPFRTTGERRRTAHRRDRRPSSLEPSGVVTKIAD